MFYNEKGIKIYHLLTQYPITKIINLTKLLVYFALIVYLKNIANVMKKHKLAQIQN